MDLTTRRYQNNQRQKRSLYLVLVVTAGYEGTARREIDVRTRSTFTAKFVSVVSIGLHPLSLP